MIDISIDITNIHQKIVIFIGILRFIILNIGLFCDFIFDYHKRIKNLQYNEANLELTVEYLQQKLVYLSLFFKLIKFLFKRMI